MTLTKGTRLGAYEIVAALGAGGMGEVYRATDTKLGREVAIKILPADVAGDPERLARFRREAQLLAALNHPNIAAIHGLEEVEGKPFLVLELVEGEDLAERLKRGPIPVDEAVDVARQIAEALEEADARGIVHRDLKPANVKVTPDGKVKVLDFGLAKARTGDAKTTGSSADLSQSPTLAHTGTAAGYILGTAAYMSPEQARGKAVDKRSDIWAFGCVLLEMLTGRPAFSGETITDLLAAVVTKDPPLSTLPAATPPAVRRLLQRCLERDLRKRLQAIGEARLVLEGGDVWRGEAVVPTAGPRRLPLLAAAIGGALLLFAAGWLLRPAPRAAASEAPVRKLDFAIENLETRLGQFPVLSPDGTRVAYMAGARLHVRRIDSLDAVEMPESDDVVYLAWSPDSRQLAYLRHGRVWKVSTEGGSPTELGVGPNDLVGSGGAVWTNDGRVVFAGSDTVGLWEIPAEGGTGRELLAIDRDAEADFHELSALPDDRGLLFTVHRKGHPADTIALLASGKRSVVLQIGGESLRHPAYSPTGHIIYVRETTSTGLWAVPFSLEKLAVTGPPFLAASGGIAPSVARDGTLSFVRTEDVPVEIVRVSRAGAVERIADLPGIRTSSMYMGAGTGSGAGLRLSPDGTRVAVSAGRSPGQLWVYDLVRGSASRLATDVFLGMNPVWTPAGERVIYASGKGARAWNLWSRRADSAGEPARVSTSPEIQVPLALSPDGWLLYLEGSGTKGNVFKMPLDGSGTPQPLFATQFQGMAASFSPDGRWLAYESLELGRPDVYVRQFPEGDERFQLSSGGGAAPVWLKSGEVLYHSNGKIYSVAIAKQGESLAVSKPTLLLETGGEAHLAPVFDMMPDGQHLIMLRSRGREHVSLIFNWARELKQLEAAGAGRAGS